MFKAGDKVNVFDGSYSFGVHNNNYCGAIPSDCRDNLTIVKVGLTVMERASNNLKDIEGEYREVCDLMLTDENGGFWFIRSDFCESVDKKIEVRYFFDGKDITDKISDETKRNLKAL